MLRPTRFFSQNTTIHGFKYTLNAFDFYFWLIPLLLSLSICFYEAQSTISKFLSFKQKITVKTFDAFKDNGQREFPAITFCPKTVFRRSAVGGVGVPLMLTGVNADWGTTNEAIQLDNKDICSGNNRLGDNPGPGVVVMSFDIQGYKKGAGALGRLYLMDSYRTAVQCKYQGRNLNCSNLFYNSWSDSGWCFTFNYDINVIKASFIDETTEMGYGTDGYVLPSQRSVGRETGFQILMNVNINDYCYPAFPYVIGFAATVHDPKSQPLLRFQQQIDLTAGFASNVDIIEKKIEMTTESYNYCSSRYNYTLGHPGDNHKSICMKECLTLEVWHHCGCILYYSPQLTYWKLMTAPFHMKNVTDKEYSGGPRRHQRFQFCHAIDVDCVQPIERRGVGVNGVCTQRCPTSCKQKKFQFGISQSRFPTPKLMNYIRKQLNFSSNYSLKAARLNLISANFFYSSAVNKLEQVDIAMTWVDLTAQLGGALGLTIGASLLSLVEIINWLIWQLGTIFSTLARIACCPVRKLEPKIYHHSVSR